MNEGEVSLMHVDGTQDEEAIIMASWLEERLHFKTTSTGLWQVKISRIILRCHRIGIGTRMSILMCEKWIGNMWM